MVYKFNSGRKGWFGQPFRHSLAGKGIKTKRFSKADFSLYRPVSEGTINTAPVANWRKGNRNLGQEKSDAALGISREERRLIDAGLMEGPPRKYPIQISEIEKEEPKIPTPSSEADLASQGEAKSAEQQAQPVEGRLPQEEEVLPPRPSPELEMPEAPSGQDKLTIADLGLQPESVDEAVTDIRY